VTRKYNPWSALQNKMKFYCISLASRDDRVQAASKEFHRVGLCKFVQFYRPQKAKYFSYGCWSSHYNLAKMFHDRNVLNDNENESNKNDNDDADAYMTVFEDDIVFDLKYSPEQLVERVTHALISLNVERRSNKWQFMYWGNVSWWSMPYAENVHRCAGLTTHAYTLSPRGSQWMMSHPPDATDDGKHCVGIDRFMTHRVKSYCLHPMIAYQSPTIKGDHGFPIMDRLFLNPTAMSASQIWIPTMWVACGIGLFSMISVILSLKCSTSSTVETKWCDPMIWIASGSSGILIGLVLALLVATGKL
jgi:hypothetical protein